MPQTRYRTLLRFALLATVWTCAVLLVLSVRNIQGEWDHAVCGVWGCSPPLAAVASCQGVWAMVLWPILIWFDSSFSRRVVRITANTVLAVSLTALFAIVVYEYFHWYRFVGPASRKYFGQRLALSTFTQVDFPVVLLFLSGLLLRWWSLEATTSRKLEPTSVETVSASNV